MPAPLHTSNRHRVSSRRRTSRQSDSQPTSVHKSAPGIQGDSVDLSSEARGSKVASINEDQERSLLKTFGKQGGLVKLKSGSKPNKTLTIHGINASPDSVKALSESSASKGGDVYTYVYDDQRTRLGKTSSGLAEAIKNLQADGEPLTIRAHSMGGRVAVDALRKMESSGVIQGKVNLEMTNPVLGGLSSANSARLAPALIDSMIPGVKPGKDMGNTSSFQKTLETTKLPSNVSTRAFVGTEDPLVDRNDPHFKAVMNGLNGRVDSVQGGDHDNTIGAVAKRR